MRDLKRLVSLAVPLALVLGAAPAFAQQEKGDTSLAGYGSFQFTKSPSFDSTGTSDSGSTTTTGLVGVQFGKFATKQLEIGVVSQLVISGGGGSTIVVGLIGGYTKYYFGKDRTRPYFGFQAGADIMSLGGSSFSSDTSSDSSNTTTSFRANLTAGVRHYVTRNGALFIELNYGATFGGGAGDQYASDTGSSSTNWDSYPSVVFGFSIVF